MNRWFGISQPNLHKKFLGGDSRHQVLPLCQVLPMPMSHSVTDLHGRSSDRVYSCNFCQLQLSRKRLSFRLGRAADVGKGLPPDPAGMHGPLPVARGGRSVQRPRTVSSASGASSNIRSRFYSMWGSARETEQPARINAAIIARLAGRNVTCFWDGASWRFISIQTQVIPVLPRTRLLTKLHG